MDKQKEFLEYAEYLEGVVEAINDGNKLDIDTIYEIHYTNKLLNRFIGDTNMAGIINDIRCIVRLFIDNYNNTIITNNNNDTSNKLLNTKPNSEYKYYNKEEHFYRKRIKITDSSIICMLSVAFLVTVSIVLSKLYISSGVADGILNNTHKLLTGVWVSVIIIMLIITLRHLYTLIVGIEMYKRNIQCCDRIKRNLIWLDFINSNMSNIHDRCLKRKVLDINYAIGNIEYCDSRCLVSGKGIDKKMMDSIVDIEFIWEELMANGKLYELGVGNILHTQQNKK